MTSVGYSLNLVSSLQSLPMSSPLTRQHETDMDIDDNVDRYRFYEKHKNDWSKKLCTLKDEVLFDFKVYVKVDSIFNLRENYKYSQYPPFYNDMKAYMKIKEEGSLPMVIKNSGRIGTLANIIHSFIDEFELPHQLLSDIIQYYCSIGTDFTENRRIRIAEYAELSGLVLHAMKESSFGRKVRVFEDFEGIHKKFVTLFTNWPAAIAYGELLNNLDDESVVAPDTTEVKRVYGYEEIN